MIDGLFAMGRSAGRLLVAELAAGMGENLASEGSGYKC
jgi:hypothetical protein